MCHPVLFPHKSASQYGDAPVRRAVPLAISLLHISNPDVLVMDTLSRLSHDQDSEVANNAIVGLGLLGAGEWGAGGRDARAGIAQMHHML